MKDALAQAAADRSKRSLERVNRAVAAMDSRGIKISLRAVAAEAGVSRNFIYTTPEALERVKSARGRSEGNRVSNLPKVGPQRGSSDESIRMRLAAALAEIDELKREVKRLSDKNTDLVAEVINLQNPLPKNVSPMRRRRF
ncbi:DUF6262 family protein [Arthrobacter sp. NPDC056886]|uniref:DUF6262 family protein n=1 Tax=Arthrobacter sp. NPDC056886 TaxID=3345960 RepID=UPI003673589D